MIRVNAASKCGLALIVALVACAASAGSARAGHGAVAISPDNTAVMGTADDPTLTIGTRTLVCDTGSLQGTTGTDSDILDIGLEFQEPCTLQPIALSAATNCSDGDFVRLHFLDLAGHGEVDELLAGFGCEVVVTGVCTLTIGPQDLPIPGGVNRADLTDDGIEIEVDVLVTNNNSVCGPTPSGVGRFTAVYTLDPILTPEPAW